MVSAIQRVLAVKPYLDARMPFPGRAEQQRQRGAGRVQHRHAPDQHADLQLGILLHQRAQEIAEHGGIRLIGKQPDAGVEIPADDNDGLARLAQDLLQRRVIIGTVDQHGSALG